MTDVETASRDRPDRAQRPRTASACQWTAGALAVLALGAVLFTIDDPGLTVDEPINVGHGKAFFTAVRADPLAPVSKSETVFRLWRTGHEHPPLARVLLGIGHALVDPAPADRAAIEPRGARPVSAAFYALLVYLATRLGWRLAGPVAGASSGLALLLMPRLFAHAHFASPEMISSALYLWGLAAAAWALEPLCPERSSAAGLRRLPLAGAVLGIALLSKLTVVLLPVAVVAATLVRLRWRGVAPLVLWGGVGGLVFCAGWPWLWPFDFPGYAPGLAGSWERLTEFLAVGVRRATIYVWYFGTQYPSAAAGVPWHFAWVFFLTTVPVGLVWLGLAGGLPWLIRRGRTSVAAQLLLAGLAAGLLFFTLPIERYDGERLFLFAFGPWAVVVGVGAKAFADFASRWVGRKLGHLALALVLCGQAYGVIHYHPVQLSYYNLFAGGLAGAERLGLEATYWGDTLTVEILDAWADAAAPGDCAVLLPTLYAGHALHLYSPGMRRQKIDVLPADLTEKHGCRWAIVFNRQGYLTGPEVQRLLRDGAPVAELARDGVWLTRVYRLEAPPRQAAPTTSTARPAQ